MRKFLSIIMVVMAFMLSATAQDRSITGRVTDEKGAPIQGVSVTPSDGKAGTLTDANGNFRISVSRTTKTLDFSSVGLKTTGVTIGSQTTINLSLATVDKILEDVVMTGYTTKKRTEFTGSSSKVGAKKFEQVPLASLEQMLQGQAPGIYIASGSGQPGSTARVNIRGVGSFGSVDPLYVLDGIPIENATFQTLNPNDFESIDILKDAASAGMYGSRGSNGVIVITSKKGKAGKTLISYRGQTGFSEAPAPLNLDLMNTAQRLAYEEKVLGGAAGILSSTALSGYPGWDYSPNNPRYLTLSPAQKAAEAISLDSIRQIDTDWPGLFFRRGNFTQHEVNASGGGQGVTFFTSLAYYNQDGILQRSNLERYTFRTNLDFKTSKLSISVRANAGFSKFNNIESEAGIALANPIAAAFLELPYRKPFLANGKVAVGTGNTGANAYDRANTTTSLVNQFKGGLGITAQYDIWGGISFRTVNGVDWRNNNTSRFIDPNSYAGTLQLIPTGGTVGQGLYNEGNGENLQLISTTGLVFTRTFNSKHAVNAYALMESIRNRNRSNSFTGYGINPRLLNTPAGITAGSAANNLIPLVSGGRTLNGIFSLFAFADYTYDKRITISGGVRRDVPSQLPKKNRVNVYWTGGATWNIGSEKFMKSQNVFQDLRLRASYGETANILGLGANFGYISTYGSSNTAYGTAIVPSSPGNEDYKLETQLVSNFGLEFGLWHNRIRFIGDYFRKDSKELFVNQEITRTTGFTSLRTNVGQIRNTGFEFDVKVDAVKSKEVLVTIGVNGAPLKNRITSLGQITELAAGTGISRVGLPFGTHYTVGYLGIDPQSGLPVYEDINGNPTTVYSAANSRATYGTYLPTFTGGASLEVSWKGFAITALIYTAQGVKRFNNESFFYETTNSNIAFNKRVEMINTWTKPGDITDYQRVSSVRQFSSKDIRDASFVRFRNLTAGYTFTPKNNKYLRSVRVWGQGVNLYTWTKWTGFDPEESNNIATYEFPNPRTYTLGVDVNF
ncbi:MAG: SusC/RagA family TonB-linked outer membrane protein [Ferruginibacter sp.]|nr:SusC/RagA family TonB-linked outer membrane protein [Ferruginibacter sp.]